MNATRPARGAAGRNRRCVRFYSMAAGAALEPRRLLRMSGVRPRDILVVLTDDHRYDAMGFMKVLDFGVTPTLDRLARGTHLRNAFVTTALCSPSRAVAPIGLLRPLRPGVGAGQGRDIARDGRRFAAILVIVLMKCPGRQFLFETKDRALFPTWHPPHRQVALPRPAYDRGPIAIEIGRDRFPPVQTLAALAPVLPHLDAYPRSDPRPHRARRADRASSIRQHYADGS